MARRKTVSKNDYVAPVKTKAMIIAEELAKAGYSKHLYRMGGAYTLKETICYGSRYIKDWKMGCDGFTVVQMCDDGYNARHTTKWHEEKRWCEIYKCIVVDNKNYYINIGTIEDVLVVASVPDEMKQLWEQMKIIIDKINPPEVKPISSGNRSRRSRRR